MLTNNIIQRIMVSHRHRICLILLLVSMLSGATGLQAQTPTLPDAVAGTLNVAYGTDSITLTVPYCNQGDSTLGTPLPITLFADSLYGRRLATHYIASPLDKDSCTTTQFTLDYSVLHGTRTLAVALNNNGYSTGYNAGLIAESDTSNNTASIAINAYTVFDTTVCLRDLPITWHDSTFYTAETKQIHYPLGVGADSVVILRLQVQIPPSLYHSADTLVTLGDTARLWASWPGQISWHDHTGAIIGNVSSIDIAITEPNYYVVEGLSWGTNLVANGDFEQGDTLFSSDYTYSSVVYSDGFYAIDTNAQNTHGDFCACGDHTSGNGSYMIINGASAPNTAIWQQTVSVQPNTTYIFSTWAINVTRPDLAPMAPRLQFSINGEQLGDVFEVMDTIGVWSQFYETWYSGSNTSATISILNQFTEEAGNDFGLDDISFAASLCPVFDTVRITTITYTYDTVCDVDIPYTWHGHTFDGSDSFDTILTAHNGMDSIVSYHLEVRGGTHYVDVNMRTNHAEWEPIDSILYVCLPDTIDLIDFSPHSRSWIWTIATPDSTYSFADSLATLILPQTPPDTLSALVRLMSTDVYGCRDSVYIPVLKYIRPEVEFRWSPDIAPVHQPEVQFYNMSWPDTLSWLWNIETAGGMAYDTSTARHPFYQWEPLGTDVSGEYDVSLQAGWTHYVDSLRLDTVVWLSGWYDTATYCVPHPHTCYDTTHHTVIVTNDYLQFPNMVSPNGDGENDLWEIRNLLEYGNYSMNELWIYDRTGAMVYHVKDIRRREQFWDPNATRSPDGTYYFRFTGKGKYGIAKRNGLIEVIRTESSNANGE